MTKRLIQFSVLPPLVGVLLTWGCVGLLGELALLFNRHRDFEWPANIAMPAQALLAWLPLCFLTGLALGWRVPKDAVALSVGTALCGLVWLNWGTPDLGWASHAMTELPNPLLGAHLAACVLMGVGLPAGAWMGRRFGAR